jgi:hypothetical protein
MACCAAPPKKKSIQEKARSGELSAVKKFSTAPTTGPLVFKTQHGDLRFEENGAVVVREAQSETPAAPSSPGSPGGGGGGGGSTSGSAPGERKGGASKLGAKRSRPGPPGGAGNRYRMATCNGEDDLMNDGLHFAEFTMTKATGNLTLGVVQQGYSPNRTLAPGEPRGAGAEGWGLSTRSGWLTFRGKVSEWNGCRPCVEGDRVGMLVDLEKGTLSVFHNGTHLGFMVKAGITGPLSWMAELNTPGDSVRVRNAAACGL